MNEPQEDEPYDVTKPRGVLYRTKWKVYQNAVYWISLKSAQDRGLAFWQTNSNAVILAKTVPADCVEKTWYIPKLKKFCIQKIHLSPRLPRRIIFKSAWQVQNEEVLHEGSTAELVADEMTTERKIDIRIHGKSRAQVEQEEEKSRKQYILKTCECNHES